VRFVVAVLADEDFAVGGGEVALAGAVELAVGEAIAFIKVTITGNNCFMDKSTTRKKFKAETPISKQANNAAVPAVSVVFFALPDVPELVLAPGAEGPVGAAEITGQVSETEGGVLFVGAFGLGRGVLLDFYFEAAANL
jgi:hypothetical protein